MIQTMQNEEKGRSMSKRVEGYRSPRLRQRALILAAVVALTTAALGLWQDTRPARAGDAAPQARAGTASAVFAGGCFWCMEKPFDELPGVTSTTSGYAGGKLRNPTYEQVSTGNTGHIEVVRVEYDPDEISYEALVDVFWRNIDPVDARGQFCDKGHQYTSAIFYGSEDEKEIAEKSMRVLEESGRLPTRIATRIVPAAEFWDAEDYHQDYYKKNPIRYRYYRYGCGRDARLEQLWGNEAGGKKVGGDTKDAG